MLKKMEQAKKKAEAVVNTVDISEREKMAQLKKYRVTPRNETHRFILADLRNYFMLTFLPPFTLSVSTRKQGWGRRRER